MLQVLLFPWCEVRAAGCAPSTSQHRNAEDSSWTSHPPTCGAGCPRAPAALLSHAWPCGSCLSWVLLVEKSLDARPDRTWLFQVTARRTGGWGFVGLIPGDLLTVEPLQGMGVTIKRSLRERKNSGGFASIARTTATESIQRWSPVTLQSKCNSQMSKLKLRWWLRRGQTCLSSVWKPGGSFAVRPAQRYVVWNHGAVLHHPASPPTRPSCQKSLITFGSSCSHVPNHL